MTSVESAERRDGIGRESPDEGLNTVFAFANKVFDLPGAHFAFDRRAKQPIYKVMLGAVRGSLPLECVRSEFHIPRNSNDGRLLDIVEQSLQYVKQIWPGDSIPRELLDGSASWSVEERHRQMADARLRVHLAAWVSNRDLTARSADEIKALAADPKTEERVRKAYELVRDRSGAASVSDIEEEFRHISRELAYIEALRERIGLIQKMARSLRTLETAYFHERAVMESLRRIRVLLRAPMHAFLKHGDAVDERAANIMGIIKNTREYIEFIRESRDDLHRELMEWDGLLDEWAEQKPKPSDGVETLIDRTYRFLASNYPQSKSWSLSSRADEN